MSKLENKSENKHISLKISTFNRIVRPILSGEIVWNNQKTAFYAGFFSLHLGVIWSPPNGPNKVSKGPQVGGRCGPMSKLENKPLTKLLASFFQEKLSKTTRKQLFMLGFFNFGVIQASPNWNKKLPKGPQVGGTYSSMSKLKDKLLTKSLGPYI
jgi:hypothetical protein